MGSGSIFSRLKALLFLLVLLMGITWGGASSYADINLVTGETVAPVEGGGGGGIPVIDYANDALEMIMSGYENISFAASNSALGTIATELGAYAAAMKLWFTKLLLFKGAGTSAESAAQAGQVDVDTKLTQAELDSHIEDVFLRAAMRARAKSVPPDNQDLCNSILVHQLGATTEAFEQSVSRLAATAADTMYRSATSDGSGPQYAAEHFTLRCEAKLGNAVDFPDSCVDKSTTGADGRKISDADISFKTFDGGQVLELPAFEDTTINGQTYHVPSPQNTAQKFWVAGLYYCLNVGGPRPTPPQGKRLDDANGRTARAQWDHCQAKRSSLMRPCFDLLAYNTRPNTSQTALIATQQVGCKAAKNLNVKLPASFEDCSHGLSPRQAAMLKQAQCKNPQQFISMILGGGKQADIMDSVIDCAKSWNSWKSREIGLETAVYGSMDGLIGMKQCWAGTEGGPR